MPRDTIIAFLAPWALVMCASAESWYDDFDDGSIADGSPVPWLWDPVTVPGIYDASSGDLVLAGLDPRGEENLLAAVPIVLSPGASIRAKAVISSSGSAGVGFGDFATFSGYVGIVTHNPDVRLARFDLGQVTLLQVTPIDIDPLQDFFVQLDVFDGQVSLRAWQDGEAFPEATIEVADATYAAGIAGVYFEESPPDIVTPTATFRFVQAGDAPLGDPCAADLDRDGSIGGADLAVVLAEWTGPGGYAPCPPLASADFDGDCDVDGADLGLVLATWGTCP